MNYFSSKILKSFLYLTFIGYKLVKDKNFSSAGAFKVGGLTGAGKYEETVKFQLNMSKMSYKFVSRLNRLITGYGG